MRQHRCLIYCIFQRCRSRCPSVRRPFIIQSGRRSVGPSVSRSVGQSLRQLTDRSVVSIGRLVPRSVPGQSASRRFPVGRLVAPVVGRSVFPSIDRFRIRSVHKLVRRLVGQLVERLVGRSVDRSVDLSFVLSVGRHHESLSSRMKCDVDEARPTGRPWVNRSRRWTTRIFPAI